MCCKCLCVQVLYRGGICGCVWYKCRLSVVDFVECVVWWLMWVMFVVRVGGSVVLRRIALLGMCLSECE